MFLYYMSFIKAFYKLCRKVRMDKVELLEVSNLIFFLNNFKYLVLLYACRGSSLLALVNATKFEYGGPEDITSINHIRTMLNK
jgi:hypothetical protein